MGRSLLLEDHRFIIIHGDCQSKNNSTGNKQYRPCSPTQGVLDTNSAQTEQYWWEYRIWGGGYG